MNAQALVLVRIRCADGVEGWGEATTIGGLNYGEESPESIKTNIETYMAPLVGSWDESRSSCQGDVQTAQHNSRESICEVRN